MNDVMLGIAEELVSSLGLETGSILPLSLSLFVLLFRSSDRLCGLMIKSSWLQIQRSGFDFLRSNGSGTGYTQPREDN
jgi:hypothetical protein